MSQSNQNQPADVETIDSGWQSLYRIGGVAALMVVAFMLIQISVFIKWPPPGTVTGWFALFQHNALVGLLDMDLLLIVDYVLLAVIYLALWAALRRASQSFMATALVLQLVGTATYFASTVAFEMLSLSNQYAAATTEAEKSVILTAGQTMVVTWQGTAFNVSYVLGAFAILIVSVVMLRSKRFGKLTAFAGILSGVAALVPPTVGTIGIILSLVSLVPLAIWLILIARTFLKLGRIENQELQQQ